MKLCMHSAEKGLAIIVLLDIGSKYSEWSTSVSKG